MENNKNILLTIGILSYNNPKELKRLLLSVLPQMQSDVEIVISDNSTNDDIEKMMNNEFTNPYVRYFRNRENVGAEKNIILVIERALGKYVWLYGDDDICDGAINHVLSVLKKDSNISFVFVNFHIADQGENNPIIKIGKDKFFDDKNQVLEELANVLGFMSSTIIKKESFNSIKNDELNRFIGSDFINLFIVLSVLAQGGKAYFINHPYVCCYPTPAGAASFDGFNVFAINFFKIIKNFENKFDKKSIKKILAKNLGHVWRGELVALIKGHKAAPRKRVAPLFRLYWNFPEFWVALPFFLMPRFVNMFFYKIYQKVKGKNSSFAKVPWF